MQLWLGEGGSEWERVEQVRAGVRTQKRVEADEMIGEVVVGGQGQVGGGQSWGKRVRECGSRQLTLRDGGRG